MMRSSLRALSAERRFLPVFLAVAILTANCSNSEKPITKSASPSAAPTSSSSPVILQERKITASNEDRKIDKQLRSSGKLELGLILPHYGVKGRIIRVQVGEQTIFERRPNDTERYWVTIDANNDNKDIVIEEVAVSGSIEIRVTFDTNKWKKDDNHPGTYRGNKIEGIKVENVVVVTAPKCNKDRTCGAMTIVLDVQQ